MRHHTADQPSTWVSRFVPLIPQGMVLDLACGSGRHARLLAAQGYEVLAVDRNADALVNVEGARITTMQIDLENDSADCALWPFEPDRFSGIVVTNYLHRPLFPQILASLAPNGVLIYETFARDNGHYGKPSNPDFLLEPGELLEIARMNQIQILRIIAFEDGYIDHPKPAMVQRICAVRADTDISHAQLRLF
jgi:SAM-dependent methyltransferase